MKRTLILSILLAAVTFVFSSGTIFSQDLGKKTPEERAKHRADKMQEHLSLSSEQYTQVYDIMLSQAQQVDALKSSSTDKDAAREKMKALRQDTDSKLTAVFNTDQTQKWNTFKEKMKEKHKNKKGKKHKKQK